MPETVNIHYAKTHLSRLLVAVAQGDEVIIAKSGTPLAKLVSVENQKPRKPGRFVGQILHSDTALAPMSDGELDLWSAGHLLDPMRESPVTKAKGQSTSKAKSRTQS
tara:strand:+ start:336 stop:656 length:321 start_codon:yes stop_codon:yes gene_type:complete